MKASSVTGLVAILVAVAILGARFVSERSAENGCTDVAERRGASAVGYEWSWWPLGTTCTFDGERSETRLIW